MTKCPKCSVSQTPGYFTYTCPETGRTVVVRCDVCSGWGITTGFRIFQWELSL